MLRSLPPCKYIYKKCRSRHTGIVSTILATLPANSNNIPSSSRGIAASRRYKRIIVCCDGTWQDGVVAKQRWQYSNVIKLARTLHHEDSRQDPTRIPSSDPPISQVVFYQPGIGSVQGNFLNYIKDATGPEWLIQEAYAHIDYYVEGATGAPLAAKVQEAYAFIAQNYTPGDEIFLFGFSRGAYTARMCAAFIGEIGLLDKKDMDHFADIFVAYQKRGKITDDTEMSNAEREEYDKILAPWNSPNSNGRLRVQADTSGFTIKAVGVWDTVGALGVPEGLTRSENIKKIFGFNDKQLGAHVQHAFHAMAIHETRVDFDVTKFEQTQEGRDKGQVLKQVWFAGSHADVGGSYERHDLADISLAWMVSNIENMLFVDREYLCSIPNPVAEWGAQIPHNPLVGPFKLREAIQRDIPTKTDDETHEMIHPSVSFQKIKPPMLEENLKKNPSLVTSLAPLEERIRAEWPYSPGVHVDEDVKQAKDEDDNLESEKKFLLKLAEDKKDEAGKA